MKITTPIYCLLAAMLAFIVSAVTAYLLPHIPLVWQISLGIAVLAAIAWAWLDRASLGETFSKKTTRYGLNSLLMAGIAFAITVFVNMIFVNHDVKVDLTKNKLHTLSDQSVKVLQGLKEEIRLRVFVSPMQMAEFDQVLDKYTYLSKLVKKEYVDVDRDPLAVQKYNIKQQGTILVENDHRSARIDNLTGPDDPKIEEKITNAIIQVTKGSKKKVYFLTGHGERMITDTGREGFSEIKEALASGRYDVADLSLLDKEKVPADAEIVIIAGPKSDFMEHELKLLEAYIRTGGKTFFMVEPTSTETLKPFLAKFGVDWHPRKAVLETNRLQQLAGGNPLTPIVTQYDPNSEITKEAKQLSIFPIATPVEKSAAAPPNGYKIDSLFSTSNRSLEVALQGDKVQVNEKTDRKGPISLAVSVSGKADTPAEAKKPEADKDAKPEDKKAEDAKQADFRMIVVGDADFAANGVRKFGINADLFQNMMSWLSQEEDLISIRPRATGESELEITEDRARLINLASIVIAPFALFISGIAVWLSRRRK